MPADVVVFVPGICGSVLVDKGQTIWPGKPESGQSPTPPPTPGDQLSKS